MNIPQELIDKIIDRIWDADDSPSHTTTKAASLISRSWVDRSQRHLFHDIRFSPIGTPFVRWCAAVSPEPNRVSRHVRSLTILARADGWWIDERILERFLPFFQSFCNVRVLRVLNWDIEHFPPEILTRCFTSFAGSVRVLQWDPHMQISRNSWTHIVELFPLLDCLLLLPGHSITGLLSDTPAGPTRKKLVVSGHAAQCLMWGAGSLRFKELCIGCDSDMTLQTVISIVNRDADQLEVLSIARMRGVLDALNARISPSFFSGCRTLRELSIDWQPVVDSVPELDLIDAIPGESIQSLRVMPHSLLWHHMWHGGWLNIEPSTLMPPYERLAQAILRLGMRSSRRKISVWFVIPRVPYVICDPIMECVVALWKEVEGVVSFGFRMTEVESQYAERYPIINLA